MFNSSSEIFTSGKEFNVFLPSIYKRSGPTIESTVTESLNELRIQRMVPVT